MPFVWIYVIAVQKGKRVAVLGGGASGLDLLIDTLRVNEDRCIASYVCHSDARLQNSSCLGGVA
jgi:alkyl hydroperoxide reductase subunit AhpF